MQEQISVRQNPEELPDIIARVFNMKLEALEEEFYSGGIFGKCIAHLRVIEFQKRGLRHAHILIILHERDRMKTLDQIDQIISAEIPLHSNTIFDDCPEKQRRKRDQAQRLRELVLKNMVHGLCGKENDNALCMYNSDGDVTQVCSKSFPKDFVKQRIIDSDNSYAKHRRRSQEDGGIEAMYNDRTVDVSWVVPYSPYLLLRYDYHINVEICPSTRATKYLYKYVTKDGDRAMMKVDGQLQQRNEVKEYQDPRSIEASEAISKSIEPFPRTEKEKPTSERHCDGAFAGYQEQEMDVDVQSGTSAAQPVYGEGDNASKQIHDAEEFKQRILLLAPME